MLIPYDNPDTGYAWVILATCFCLHFLLSSSYATLGLLLVEYLQHFRQDKTVTSWIGAMQLSMCGMMGLFVGPLVHRFGARWMVRVGTVLVVSGYVMSALAPSVYVLYFTQGLVTGSGFSCWVVSVNVVVQQWFDRKRGFAVALSTVGLSSGVLVWSYSTRMAIEWYDYQGTLVLIAAANLHGFVIAALLRPPRYRPITAKLQLPERGEDTQLQNGREDSLCSDEDSYLSSLLCDPAPATNDSLYVSDEKQEHNKSVNVTECNHGLNNSSVDITEQTTERECLEKCGEKNAANQLATAIHPMCTNERTLDEKHIHLTKKYEDIDLSSLADKDSFSSQDSGFINPKTIAGQEVVSEQKTPQQKFPIICLHTLKSIFTNIVDVSLLKTRAVPLYLLAIFFSNFGHMIPYSFIPIRVVNGGASKEAAALLVTIMGIGSCCGRLCFGWIGDRPWANRRLMFAVANVFVGSVSALSYIFTEYRILIGYCAIYSVFSACYVSVQATIIGDIVPRNRLPRAIGLFVFFIGIAILASTSLSGYLLDVWGNPAAPFLVMGCIQAFGGLLALTGYFCGGSLKQAGADVTAPKEETDESC